MKYLHVIALMLLAFMVSCNKSNEPPTEIRMPITRSFMPVTLTFDKNDKEVLNKCIPWKDKFIVVNSAAELPDDPIGFSSSYSAINYKERTLLIGYKLHGWKIDAYENMYVKNNVEKTLNWTIRLGIREFGDEDHTELELTRFAIEVPKPQVGFEPKLWWSLGSLYWDWDK